MRRNWAPAIHIEELEALNDARLPVELDLEDAIKATVIDHQVKSVQGVSRKFEGKNKPSNRGT